MYMWISHMDANHVIGIEYTILIEWFVWTKYRTDLVDRNWSELQKSVTIFYDFGINQTFAVDSCWDTILCMGTREPVPTSRHYPLVNVYIAIESGHLQFPNFPSKNGDFPIVVFFFNVFCMFYHRVSCANSPPWMAFHSSWRFIGRYPRSTCWFVFRPPKCLGTSGWRAVLPSRNGIPSGND